MPLHITLSKLVFTSHCICFYYIMICPVSSEYTIGVVSFAWPQYIGFWLWIVIALVICFLVICFLPCLLTRYCLFHVSNTYVTSFVFFVFTVCWLTLNRSLFRFYCIWHCLLTRHWFIQCQQHLYIGVILQHNSGSIAATLNKSPFQYVYFSLGYCVFTSF